MKRAVLLVLAGLGLGCGHDVNVKVPEKPLPARFDAEAGPKSAASVSWREFFADAELNGLIGGAIAGSPDVKVALQRIELARAGVRHATGALLPQVSLAAGAGVQKYGRYTVEGAGNQGAEIAPGRAVPTHVPDFAIGLQSTWEVDAWGKLRNQRDAAVARYLASVEGTNLVITGLVADMARAYYELLALDLTHDVLKQTLVRQQEALEVVRLQKQAGRANELAVQQFQVQLTNTQALELETLARVREAEVRINLLRGSYPQAVVRRKEALLADVAPTLATGVPSELLRNRPDIRAAELEIQAAKCDLHAARAAFYPSLTIAAGVGYQAFNPRFLFSTPESLVYSATAGLVAPLVNRSAIEAQFAGAKAYQIQAMYEYQRAVLVAYAEVASGLSGLKSSSELISLRRAQKTAIEQSVSTADDLYRAGKASYFEVLMAQQSTLSIELQLIEALKARRAASVGIYQALGGGWR
jgi:outer membrane protein, multidrug efflux system